MFAKSTGRARDRDGLEAAERGAAVGLALEPDVRPGGEAVPGDTHRGVQPEHDRPGHRHHDLEHGHEPDQVDQLGLGRACVRLADPCGQREVRGRRPVLAVQLSEGVLLAAQGDDADADRGDDELHEVALPHGGAEESAAPATGTGPGDDAVDRQPGDREQHHPGDELGDPLVEVEVADQRQREVGVEQLAVGRHQREEQEPEPDEHEPVGRAHPVPLQHPGVAEGLLEHVRPARPPRVGASEDGLAELDDADDLRRSLREQRDRDQRDRDGHHGGEDLHVDLSGSSFVPGIVVTKQPLSHLRGGVTWATSPPGVIRGRDGRGRGG